MSAGGHVRVYTDGAARGNPGPAGAGALITDEDGTVLGTAQRYLGEATNNVAEYQALILGLERAAELGAVSIEVLADSQLVVFQMSGDYKVRSEHLLELHERARTLATRFRSVRYIHIPRDENRDADRLANQAIDDRDLLA